MLRARLTALAEEQAADAASAARRSQVRTVDRSERIRTYNFPQNRITDHRIGYTAYNLDLSLAGELDGVLDALTDGDAARLLLRLPTARAGRSPGELGQAGEHRAEEGAQVHVFGRGQPLPAAEGSGQFVDRVDVRLYLPAHGDAEHVAERRLRR